MPNKTVRMAAFYVPLPWFVFHTAVLFTDILFARRYQRKHCSIDTAQWNVIYSSVSVAERLSEKNSNVIFPGTSFLPNHLTCMFYFENVVGNSWVGNESFVKTCIGFWWSLVYSFLSPQRRSTKVFWFRIIVRSGWN